MELWLLTGFFLGGGLGLLAWRTRSLSVSGAWAATLTGGLIFGLGGWSWALLLLTFFVSSSVFSRIFKERKTGLGEKFAKGSQRDWGQVFANGGLGVILVIAQVGFPAQVWPWVAYAGALATVNADTWATELGVLSRTAPRLITTGKLVAPGTSGGVTFLGTLATLAGGALIGLLAGAASDSIDLATGLAVGSLAGLAGSLLDSLLGASVQAMYFCPKDKQETEQHPLHRCGTATSLTRGWRWLNNDLVNFISSVFGAATALSIWTLLD